jgi:hypothetical protein
VQIAPSGLPRGQTPGRSFVLWLFCQTIPFGRHVKPHVEGLDRLEFIRPQNIVKDIA